MQCDSIALTQIVLQSLRFQVDRTCARTSFAYTWSTFLSVRLRRKR